MAHLIDKDAVLAEIDRMFDKHSSKHDIDEAGVVLLQLQESVGKLEVTEVDLEKELNDFIEKVCEWIADYADKYVVLDRKLNVYYLDKVTLIEDLKNMMNL